MDWLRRYRFREFVRSSFWAGPACALLLGIAAANVLRRVDAFVQWRGFEFTPDGAKTLLGASVASMLTFVVVLVSSILLVVQLVSVQLTPRIIAPAFRNPLIRLTLSAFVFTYTLSTAVLGRVSDTVPQVAVSVTVVANVLCIMLFLYFIGSVGMNLRPARVLTSVAAKGRDVITSTYPAGYDPSNPLAERCAPAADLGEVVRVFEHARTSGVLLAFDADGLVALARQHRAVIRLVPRVGDFVATGEPLFKVYAQSAPTRTPAASAAASVEPRTLVRMVAFGAERTMEQDPAFAFRIVVDIASKALSPAINDPTTAVLAIDQVHRLLRWVGTRQLHSGRLADADGTTRVVFATPTWEDFVWVAVAEVRHYGTGCLQVYQRLHATLRNLIQFLPDARRPPLREQLRLLDLEIDRSFGAAEDRQRVRSEGTPGDGAPDSAAEPAVPHAA